MNMHNPPFNKHNTEPSTEVLKITGVAKKSGKIVGYQLSDGSQVEKQQGVEMAKQNKIQGVGVATNQGTEYLRGLPDGEESNNIASLSVVPIIE